MKAIETIYKGFKYRSRQEARWAVFLDALNINWDYEPEGFDLDGVWYLPDFHLLDVAPRTWLEVKKQLPDNEREFNNILEKAIKLSQHKKKMSLFFLVILILENTTCFLLDILVKQTPWSYLLT